MKAHAVDPFWLNTLRGTCTITTFLTSRVNPVLLIRESPRGLSSTSLLDFLDILGCYDTVTYRIRIFHPLDRVHITKVYSTLFVIVARIRRLMGIGSCSCVHWNKTQQQNTLMIAHFYMYLYCQFQWERVVLTVVCVKGRVWINFSSSL